jgi:hypothetical protein
MRQQSGIKTPIGGWHRAPTIPRELRPSPAAPEPPGTTPGQTNPRADIAFVQRERGFGWSGVSMFLNDQYVDAHPRIAGLLAVTVLWVPATILGALSDPVGCGPLMFLHSFFGGLRYLLFPPPLTQEQPGHTRPAASYPPGVLRRPILLRKSLVSYVFISYAALSALIGWRLQATTGAFAGPTSLRMNLGAAALAPFFFLLFPPSWIYLGLGCYLARKSDVRRYGPYRQ